MMPNKTIKLKSSEGVIVETSVKCAKMAMTIREMLENVGQEFDESTEVPIENVDAKTLRKIVDWMEHWKDTPQPTSEDIKEKLVDSIDEWDEEYLKIELPELYELITASNYLNVPGLLWNTTRAVAYMMKGKSPEEIRQLFNIPNDWTPEELDQVQKENQWCEEK